MGTVKITIGTIQTGNSGQVNDTRRVVQFEGERVGSVIQYGMGRDGGITDTRGVTETLYKADDGRLIVHIDDWTRWQGEPSTEGLRVVNETDLQPGGEFEQLGIECDYGRPLTLDEAIRAAE